MQSLINSSEEHLSHAITSLATVEFSQAIYDWLRRCFEIDNCTILAFYQTRQPELFFSHTNVKQVHERMERDYLSSIYLLDPFHDLHVDKAEDGLYRLRDCAPDHFHRNEYYAKYYGRTTMIDEICYHARVARGVSVQLCLGRDRSSGRSFSGRDMEVAQRISTIACGLMKKQWSNLSARGDYTNETLVKNLQKKLLEHREISLSKRQCEVALLILRGHSTISIGLRLGISPQTVKVFRKQLYRKCEISSQAELFSLMSRYLAS
ncbi:helix-turn-helix transcriptional regulator [Tritonibacter litoralis]|nr:helix-turn-helix transcriptional regulator [Tritonibacter litoralis]